MEKYNILLLEDLKHIVYEIKDIWEVFRNKKLLLTGGTGFFGKWLLETFSYANTVLNLNCKIIVLSRNPDKFTKEYSYFAQNEFIYFLRGDVLDMDLSSQTIDFVIHAATDSGEKLNTENPLLMFDTIVSGTRNILELARGKNISSFLYISSGAVYGKQPEDILNIPENFSGAPNTMNLSSSYGMGKRCAEYFCKVYNDKYSIPIKIARCFAFVGPYLPTDAHFAIGNFIRDGLKGGPIVIKGDGTPLRSYLYTSDLVIWLLKVLILGKSMYPYNIGSDQGLSISEVANIVKNSFDNEILITRNLRPVNGKIPERYVPSIHRSKELGLKITVDINLAVKKTIEFNDQIGAMR